MKPLIVGMNNPLHHDPKYALYPAPAGCTGWRLWKMLRMRVPDALRTDYLSAFDRLNLVNAREWDAAVARRNALALVSELKDTGRTVLVLGNAPRQVLGLPALLIHPQEIDGVVWRQLPHPSGLCRWYNDKECAELAALLLEELYELGRRAA